MGTAATVIGMMAAAVAVAGAAVIGTVSMDRPQTILLIETSGRRSFTDYLLETPSQWKEVSSEARYNVVSVHVSSGHESSPFPYLTSVYFDTDVSPAPLYLRPLLFPPQSSFSPTLRFLMPI